MRRKRSQRSAQSLCYSSSESYLPLQKKLMMFVKNLLKWMPGYSFMPTAAGTLITVEFWRDVCNSRKREASPKSLTVTLFLDNMKRTSYYQEGVNENKGKRNANKGRVDAAAKIWRMLPQRVARKI